VRLSAASTSVKVPAGSTREKTEPTVAFWLPVCAASVGASLAREWWTVSVVVDVGTGRIAHGVAEAISHGIGRLPQGLHGGIRLVTV